MMTAETMEYPAQQTGLRGQLLAWRARLERMPLSLVQLVCRFAIAGVFLRAGLQKLSGWETTLALFREEYKVPLLRPELAASMAVFTEVACSTLILLGLATRLATLPFFGMILTIQLFVFPQAWPEHLTWTSILLVLLTRGPGVVSVDQIIGFWLEQHRKV